MASDLAPFNTTAKVLHDGTVNLLTDTLKVALLSSAFDPLPGVPTFWGPSVTFAPGSFLRLGGVYFEATTQGTTGFVVPSFNAPRGQQTTDGGVVWKSWGYCPPSSHSVFANVSATELPSGLGYISGGQTITGSSVVAVGRSAAFSTTLPMWSNAGFFGARFAVVYRTGTVNALVNPLVCYMLMDNAPQDIVLPGSADTDFVLDWGPSGLLVFS